MALPDDWIDRFCTTYERVYGVPLAPDEAQAMGSRLVMLVELMGKRRPGSSDAAVSPEEEAHDAQEAA
jgi:hypothetical protein